MESTPPPVRRDYAFEFTGKSGEYFRIWIVNILLTIATLGIYSAWAKVRNNRYFYGNTVLDGSAFEYTADPIRILKGRLIAVALVLIYQFAGVFSWKAGLAAGVVLLLVFPALVILSMRFRMRYTSWRNIQFSFKPAFKKAYLLFGIPLLLFVFVLYGASQMNRIVEEYGDVHQYEEGVQQIHGAQLNGQIVSVEEGPQLHYDESPETPLSEEDQQQLIEELEAELTEEEQQRQQEFASKVQEAMTVLYIPLFIFWILFPWWLRRYYEFLANHSRFGTSHFAFISTTSEFYAIYLIAALLTVPVVIAITVLAMGAGAIIGDSKWALAVIVPLVMIIPMLAVNAYIETKKTNVIYSGLTLGDIGFTSNLKFGKMFWLYISNTAAILLSLGLLIPWAKIRMARYRAECMTLYAADFDGFQARQNSELGAQAAEFGDVMDFDLGL